MRDELTTVVIHNRTCHIYKKGGSKNGSLGENRRMPVFYWGAGKAGRESAETVVSYLKRQMTGAGFILAAYESEDWNDDFSPWAAPAVFVKENFGGRAGDTLEWLTEHCIPAIEAEKSEIARFPVGYSLAGLFALWVYCECDIFSGAVSCSGSLWYEGWLDYLQKAAIHRNETNYIYLSLGAKEEKTKNRLMSTVGDRTEKTYAMLCENRESVKGVLEWNQGGHFSDPELRIAKGINWILQHFDV